MRRRFDHLVMEISLAVGRPIPRYPLWLRFHEHGCDPELLTDAIAVAFCDGPLAGFLAENGFTLSRRGLRRLRRAVARFEWPVLRPRLDDALDAGAVEAVREERVDARLEEAAPGIGDRAAGAHGTMNTTGRLERKPGSTGFLGPRSSGIVPSSRLRRPDGTGPAV